MKALRPLLCDERGGPAAEFALILPLILLFRLGIIDVGRYAWEINRAEKATQTGARWAAATEMMSSRIYDDSVGTRSEERPVGHTCCRSGRTTWAPLL